MDKNNIKSVFKEYLNPLDAPILSKMAAQMKLDKYVKKLDTLTFTKLFIYAELAEIQSLTETSFRVNHSSELQEALQLQSISTSQLSRKLCQIPPTIFDAVLRHLIQKVRQIFGFKKGNQLLEKLYIIDSSTITLGLSQYPWAPKNRYTGGVKMHTRVVYQDEITYLDRLIITAARPADRTQLDELIVNQEGALYVFDRGYYDYKKFQTMTNQGIRFVTRLKENAVYRVVEERPITSESEIKREAIIFLGNMKTPLRLIEVVDSTGIPIQLVVNEANLSAKEVSEVYRKRWQIELFFKWMKQHTVLKSCFSKSYNGVHNQIYLAMIAFCLTLFMHQKMAVKRTLLVFKRMIQHYYFDTLEELVEKLTHQSSRRNRGRQKVDYVKSFEEIEKQYGLK